MTVLPPDIVAIAGAREALARRGWIAVARRALLIKWSDGNALAMLAFSPGRFIAHDRLDGVSRMYEAINRPRTNHVSTRLPTRMARIRKALVQVGFPPSAIENDPGVGYAMAPHHASRLHAFIAQAALDGS